MKMTYEYHGNLKRKKIHKRGASWEFWEAGGISCLSHSFHLFLKKFKYLD